MTIERRRRKRVRSNARIGCREERCRTGLWRHCNSGRHCTPMDPSDPIHSETPPLKHCYSLLSITFIFWFSFALASFFLFLSMASSDVHCKNGLFTFRAVYERWPTVYKSIWNLFQCHLNIGHLSSFVQYIPQSRTTLQYSIECLQLIVSGGNSWEKEGQIAPFWQWFN